MNGSCTYFDFFGLPLELRESIYELVFTTPSGTITRVDPKEKPTVVSTSILQISRKVYAEARAVLYRTTACKLTVNPKGLDQGYRLARHDLLPFACFRSIELDIFGQSNSGGRNGQKVGSLGAFITNMTDMLAMLSDCHNCKQTKVIKMTFAGGKDTDTRLVVHSQYMTYYGHCVFFYLVQAAGQLEDMHKSLATRASQVVVSSNVEAHIAGLETRRVDYSTVRYRINTQGRQEQ